MDLAIVNCTHAVVAWGKMRIPPGGKVRLSSYYPSEEHARHDLTLMKFVNANKLRICSVDFEDPAVLAKKIADLEAKADAEQAEAQDARRARTKQKREHRADHQAARQRARGKERAALVAQAEQKAELDLGALFETSRKQRLASVMKEREEIEAKAKIEELLQAAQEAPPLEVVLDTIEALKELVPAEAPSSEEVHETKPQVEERVEDLLDSPVDLIKMQDELVSEAVFGQPGELPLATPSGKVSRIDLELLSDEQLRSLLDQFDVKGRDKIKKHSSLVNAVDKLGLLDVDLAQMLPAKE